MVTVAAAAEVQLAVHVRLLPPTACRLELLTLPPGPVQWGASAPVRAINLWGTLASQQHIPANCCVTLHADCCRCKSGAAYSRCLTKIKFWGMCYGMHTHVISLQAVLRTKKQQN